MMLRWEPYGYATGDLPTLDENEFHLSSCFKNHRGIEGWVRSFKKDHARREDEVDRRNFRPLEPVNMDDYQVTFVGSYEVKFKVQSPDDRGAIEAALTEFDDWLDGVCGIADVRVIIE